MEAVCLALVALACLATLHPLLLGRVLLPVEGLALLDPVVAAEHPGAPGRPLNLLTVPDLAGQVYPWRIHAARMLASGRVALWDPYAGCGTPSLANAQSAVLDPANLLLNALLPPADAHTIRAVLTRLLACFGAYGFCRALGAGPPEAALGGITFGLTGFMAVWLGYPLAAAAAWLPAVLWAVRGVVARPTPARAAGLAAIIGWQLLSGHPGASAQLLAFAALYAAFGLRARARAWAALAVAGALGGGLSAAATLPLCEHFRVCAAADGRRSRWGNDTPGEALRKGLLGDWWFLRSVARGEVALLFNPEAHGNPAFEDYLPHPEYGNYAERASCPGALAIVALLAALVRPPPGPRRFFAIAAWATFGVLLHLPGFHLAVYLPGLRLVSPARLRFVFSLCAALTLALAAGEWTAPQASRARRAMAWAALACAALSAVVAGRAMLRLAPMLTRLGAADTALRLAKLWAPPALGLALAVAAWAALRCRLSSRALTAILLGACVLDASLFVARWQTTTPRARALPRLASVERARRAGGLGRITGPPVALHANLATAYGLYDCRVYDPVAPRRYIALVGALSGADSRRAPSAALGAEPRNARWERLVSVRLAWELDDAGRPRLRRVADSLPRAYVAGAVRFCRAGEALAHLRAGLDPRRIALIEGWSHAVGEAHGTIRPARLLGYQPHRVVVEAAAARPGWLVLTDTHCPGWRARVNGRPTPIALANYAFRAVPVPAGTSTVVLTYEPASYRVGAFASLCSLAMLTAIYLASLLAPRCYARG